MVGPGAFAESGQPARRRTRRRRVLAPWFARGVGARRAWLGAAPSARRLRVLPPAAPSPTAPAVPPPSGPWDWPTYGHDAQHTFHGRTTLTKSSVKTLRKAWFFPTGDAVTATPTVVGGTVYVGRGTTTSTP